MSFEEKYTEEQKNLEKENKRIAKRREHDVSLLDVEKHHARKKIVRAAALSCALVTAVLFSIAFLLEFEGEAGLFKLESKFAMPAFYIMLAFCAVTLALPFIIVPKEEDPTPSLPAFAVEGGDYLYQFPLLRFARWMLAVVLLAVGTLRCYTVIADHAQSGVPFPLQLFAAFTVLPLALSLLPELIEPLFPKAKGKAHIVFGCVGLLWFFLNILLTFFDKNYVLAGVFPLCREICMITAMLAFVYEMRVDLDGAKRRSRLASSSAAAITCFGFGIGQVMGAFAGNYTDYDAVALAVMTLAVGVYFCCNLAFYEENA